MVIIFAVLLLVAVFFGAGGLGYRHRHHDELTQQNIDTKLSYPRIRQLEMTLYGRYYTRWDGTIIPDDSPEGKVQAKRDDNKRAYNAIVQTYEAYREYHYGYDSYSYGYGYHIPPSSYSPGRGYDNKPDLKGGWDTYNITDHNYD
jgi:hypothetical protein